MSIYIYIYVYIFILTKNCLFEGFLISFSSSRPCILKFNWAVQIHQIFNWLFSSIVCLSLTIASCLFFQAIFNPQGTRILTASSDKTARLWDPITGDCVQVRSFNHFFVVNACVMFIGYITGSFKFKQFYCFYCSCLSSLISLLRRCPVMCRERKI